MHLVLVHGPNGSILPSSVNASGARADKTGRDVRGPLPARVMSGVTVEGSRVEISFGPLSDATDGEHLVLLSVAGSERYRTDADDDGCR